LRTRAPTAFSIALAQAMPIASFSGCASRYSRDTELEWVYRYARQARLVDLIRKALVAPKRRVATRPTLGSKKRRLKAKKVRGEVKSLRSRPAPDQE